MDNFSYWLTAMVAAEAAVLLLIVAFMLFRYNRTKHVHRRAYLIRAAAAEDDHLKSLNVEAEVLQAAIKLKVDQSKCPDPARIQALQCEIHRSRDELARLREWLVEATAQETNIIASNIKLLRQKNGRLSYELLDLIEDVFGRLDPNDDQQFGPLKLLAAS